MAFIVIAVVCFEGLWLHCALLKTSFLSYRKSANTISVKKLLSKGSWDIFSAQEDMELSSRWATRNPIHIIHQSSLEETAVIISTWSPHRSLRVIVCWILSDCCSWELTPSALFCPHTVLPSAHQSPTKRSHNRTFISLLLPQRGWQTGLRVEISEWKVTW